MHITGKQFHVKWRLALIKSWRFEKKYIKFNGSVLFDWIWSYLFICSRILMSIETVGCVMLLKQGWYKPKENSLSISFHFDCWWICGLIGRDDMKTFRTVQRLQTQNNRWIYKAISIPLRFQCKICTSTVFSYGLTKLFNSCGTIFLFCSFAIRVCLNAISEV